MAMKFIGYSIPDIHRIQLNFQNDVSSMALNYHNWKSCFKKLCLLLENGVINIVTFDKCSTLAMTYLK